MQSTAILPFEQSHETALSNREQRAYQRCEGIIQKGMTTFREVGNALLEIRDSRLYRREYESFADYCKERWKFTRQRAHQLIDAAKVTEQVSTIVDIPNKAVARELAKGPAEKRQPTLDWATEKSDGAPLTAAAIRQAAAEVLETEPDEEDDSEPAEPDDPSTQLKVVGPYKSRGVGVDRANEAINCLARIPKNDALRKRGFQIVIDWIKANQGQGGNGHEQPSRDS